MTTQIQNIQHINSADLSIGLHIDYIGLGVGTFDSFGSSTSFVFTDTEAGATLPDDGTTAAGTLLLTVTTVDTCGEMINIINASSGFRARMVNAISSDETNGAVSNFTDNAGPITFTELGLDVFWDSSDLLAAAAIAPLGARVSIGPESDTTILRGQARDSRANFGRKEPATDSTVADAEIRQGSRARVDRVTHMAGGDDTDTPGGTSIFSVFDAGQTSDDEDVIFTSPTTEVSDDDNRVVVSFDPPLFSSWERRLVVAQTLADTTDTDEEMDAYDLIVNGAYALGGKFK